MGACRVTLVGRTGEGGHLTFIEAFPGVLAAVAAEFDCRPSELLAGGKLPHLNLSEARAIAAWMAHGTGTVSFPALGRLLGMGHPAVCARVKAVANRREREPRFRELCDRLLFDARFAGRPVVSADSYAKVAGGPDGWTGVWLRRKPEAAE